jgi:ketosteroid isomerase-like protein
MITLILLAVSGLGLLISFASWLIHLCSIQQPIRADPLNLVNEFHDAVNNEDIDAMLELFAEEATIHDGESIFNGRIKIRGWALHSSNMAGLRLTLISSQVAGEKVFWRDLACNGPEAQYPSHILQWMAVIQQSKVKTLTVSPLPMPDAK